MELSNIFSNHMVLQAHKPIRIFGTGSGQITIDFAGVHEEKIMDEDRWLFELPAQPYGGPYTMRITLSGQKIVFDDVYVGEVLLLAGQSNIELPVKATTFPTEQVAGNAMLRCFEAPRFSGDNYFKPEKGWNCCSKENALYWSAIGYHIGMDWINDFNVAIGMIFCYQGSSVISSWIPSQIALEKRFALKPEERYDSPYVNVEHNGFGRLYQCSLTAIAPYSIGHVVWYQGESNTGTGEWKIYTELLKELIFCWREDFLDNELPFIVVQIADYDERKDGGWKGIQLAQEKIVDFVDNVKVIKSADLCETNDIHPPTKLHLAKRIYDAIQDNLSSRQ